MMELYSVRLGAIVPNGLQISAEITQNNMDKNRFKKECMGIVNQLFDLAEVSVEKRQAINDKADEYLQEQFLRLFAVSGRSEQFNCGKERVFGEDRCDKQCNDCLKEYGSN